MSTFSQCPISTPTPTITSYETHTMGTSLKPYLDMKVHHLIPSRNWTSIEVIGEHIRDAPAIIFDKEKNDKPYNTQRPTATILSDDELCIQCFPGKDYVQHYANIIATHLSLEGRDPTIVKIKLPKEDEGYMRLLVSNLQSLAVEKPHLVIVGSIPDAILSTQEPWCDAEATDKLFSWQTTTQPHGLNVTLLRCRVSFWGDLAGDLVRCLRDICGPSLDCVIYIGKLGALAKEHIPNRTLATGTKSYINGRFIEWKNPISENLIQGVATGLHYTSGSVLDEDKAWFEKMKDEFHWVEPEIGNMALAAEEKGVRFGFLHIVSNNLAGGFEFDLGNEREGVVVCDRSGLNGWIERILKGVIGELDGKRGKTM